MTTPPPSYDPYYDPNQPWSGPGYSVSGPPNYPMSAPPGYPMSAPPGYPMSAPPGYPMSAPPGYPPVAPPFHQALVPARYGLPMPMAHAPYGIDPVSGLPLSDKSKISAGLLQIIPGVLLGLGGIGRLYAGNTSVGTIQIVASVIGWIAFWCGFVLILPFFLFFACWIWFIVDGIILITGRPLDGAGRVLRS